MTDEPKQSDLSKSVVSLGREIDRLPPGEFVIMIIKPDPPSTEAMRVEISKVERFRNWIIPRD